MIRITYSRDQKPLAEQIRDDLRSASLSQPLLIVLVSRQSNADPHVQSELEAALADGARVLPILAEDIAPPASLENRQALDFSAGYNRERLLRQLDQAARRPDALRRANRRGLIIVGAFAILMFCIALIVINRGLVAFPVAEYNEEATFQAQWVDGLIGETLAAVQPRTTEDALQFAATYEAAPTRLHFYIRATATAAAKSGGD